MAPQQQTRATSMAIERRTETRNCPQHGDYPSEGFMIGNGAVMSSCPKCNAARELEAAQREAAAKLASRLRRASIPKRYADKGFHDYLFQFGNTGQAEAMDRVSDYARNFKRHRGAGRCLLLLGDTGTGKTHLAIAALKLAIESGFTGRFATAAEIIDRVQATKSFRTATESKADAIGDYVWPDLLVLDDVGASHGTEAEQVILTDILAVRYADQRPTIVTTNLDLKNLRTAMGDRGFDRLRENGGIAVPMKWASYRDGTNGEQA